MSVDFLNLVYYFNFLPLHANSDRWDYFGKHHSPKLSRCADSAIRPPLPPSHLHHCACRLNRPRRAATAIQPPLPTPQSLQTQWRILENFRDSNQQQKKYNYMQLFWFKEICAKIWRWGDSGWLQFILYLKSMHTTKQPVENQNKSAKKRVICRPEWSRETCIVTKPNSIRLNPYCWKHGGQYRPSNQNIIMANGRTYLTCLWVVIWIRV